MVPALIGVVLSGGLSTRMGRDKGTLQYVPGVDQRTRCFRLLQEFCEEVVISCRREQASLIAAQISRIYDDENNLGPSGGIVSVHRSRPEAALLVMACDMPYVTHEVLAHLFAQRNPACDATVFFNTARGTFEPLLAIWEPTALRQCAKEVERGQLSPVQTLRKLNCQVIEYYDSRVLRSVNAPEKF